MKIGIVADPPLVTHSVAVVASNLAKQWVKQGHEVYYLGYNYEGEEIKHPDGYTIYPDTEPPTRKGSVLKFIKDTGVEVLWAHGSKDVFVEGMYAAKEKGIPYVPHTFYSGPLKTDKVSTFEAKSGFVLYDCGEVDDMWVCNNFSVGVGYALGKRTWFLPNGMDPEFFYPHEEGNDSDNYRQELGIPYNAFVVLFSGSNIAGKDPIRAIGAFAEFYKNLSEEGKENVFLAMHTRPEHRHANLREIANKNGVGNNVKFFTDAFPEWLEQPKADEKYRKNAYSPPYTTTPYELMGNVFRTGDVQIVPTLMEGMSTTILEGMGCGLPTICSDDPVISEPVVPYQTGLLVRRFADNYCIQTELVEAIHKLYLYPGLVRDMSVKAQQLALIQYNWSSIAKQAIYLFENLINKRYE